MVDFKGLENIVSAFWQVICQLFRRRKHVMAVYQEETAEGKEKKNGRMSHENP
jgi:hypothetical protein